MTSDTRKELLTLATQHGDKFWIDAAKCRAILSDVGKMFSKSEIFALVSAVSLGLPKIIKSETSPTPWAVRRLQYLKTMREDTGIQEQLALWSLDGWAIAFGKISSNQLTSKALEDENNPTQIASSQLSPLIVGNLRGNELLLQIVRVTNRQGVKRHGVTIGHGVTIDFELSNYTNFNFTVVATEFTVFDKDGFVREKQTVFTKNVRPNMNIKDRILINDLDKSDITKLWASLDKYSTQVDCKQLTDCKVHFRAFRESKFTCESLVTEVQIDSLRGSIYVYT